MKVLLIQPPEHAGLGLQSFILAEPLGLEAVAASLAGEHEVQILDARLESGIRRRLSSFKPDAVGVSASFTSNVYSSFKVLEMVRDYNPDIHTFVGGYHATLCNSDFKGRVDAVVLGEGESTAPELLRFWERGDDLSGVDGVAFQCNGEWKQTKPRNLIEDLDGLPLPARNLTSKYQEHYFQGNWQPCAFVETSRGCPYRCNFCAVWRFHRGTTRLRSPESIVQELQEIEAPYVSFCDDNFFIDPSRTQRVCQGIKEAGIKKWFQAQIRADTIVKHTELIKEWASIGLKTAFVGLESATQKGLDSLKKTTTIQNNDEAIGILEKLKIGIMGSFIVDPDFTKKDFAELRGYVRRMKLGMPLFWVLTPIPGTVLNEDRSSEITSDNYELYDGIHAVLPTRLGLKGFYRQYAKLYRNTYITRFLSMGVPRKLWSSSPITSIKRTFRLIWELRYSLMPGALVKHHRLSPEGYSRVSDQKDQ